MTDLRAHLGSLFLLLLVPPALAVQGGGGLPQGVSREQMWPAPTAEDWKLPCLIQWERTYEDALAVSKETGKPILVCVNMDGEPASEHYAGIRYRRPETAKLYEAYVCVIASVYRHNPRDYDEQGQRILCPRFGGVTCYEHIWIEPGLHDKFFDGKRIAPRHIGVDLEKSGAEMYDVYYAFDTDTIFDALRDGVKDRPAPAPIARGDRPILERVSGRANEDRSAVELAYFRGDREQRRALLDSAAAHSDTVSVDLLRLALRGLDLEQLRAARAVLAQSTSESAVELIHEALRVPMEASERESLVVALERLGEKSPRARTLAMVHRGLGARSSVVDLERWSQALLETPGGVARDRAAVEARLADAEASAARIDDANAKLELAEATLALAVDSAATPKIQRAMYQEARSTALEAERLGSSGWRVQSTVAISAYYLGERDEAYARAQSAMDAMPVQAQDWNSMAVLAIFAEARRLAIEKALREKTPWPSQWLADAHAAYSVLARHPLGTDEQAAAHCDFLRQLGASDQAARALDAALQRFPDSWAIHARVRGRILTDKGADALEPTYEAMLREPGVRPHLEWFAGYASMVAAEYHKRAGRASDALAAYERAIGHYERAVTLDEAMRDTSDHYAALAIAGRARIAFERRDYERAVADLLASFARKPGAAASLDGLNSSPVDTAKMLLARLKEAQKVELAAKVEAALSELDPALLALPAYETETPDDRPASQRPVRRRQ